MDCGKNGLVYLSNEIECDNKLLQDSNLPNWSVQAAQEVLDTWRANAKKILPSEAFLDTAVSERIPGAIVEKIVPIVNKVKEFIQSLNDL